MPKLPSSEGEPVNLPFTLCAPATNGADYGYDARRNPDGLSEFLGLLDCQAFRLVGSI
jgi:hypothetical protein